MGTHGNSTCVITCDEATAPALGRSQSRPQREVVMANGPARRRHSGLAASEVAYQKAAQYAKDRLQVGRHPGVKAPDKPADPIIVQPISAAC
jgi:alkylation response protein AidB-like acyl-CoA dehydrogenase